MAEERDEQEFGGTEGRESQQQFGQQGQQPTGQQGQQPAGQQGQQAEFGQQGQQSGDVGSQQDITGQSGQPQLDESSETLTTDQSDDTTGESNSSSESFIGSQGSSSGDYLQGGDLSKQGRGSIEQGANDDDSGTSENSDEA